MGDRLFNCPVSSIPCNWTQRHNTSVSNNYNFRDRQLKLSISFSIMVNISSSIFTNKLVNISKEGETRNLLYEVNSIINVIINSITCPLTVLLNVLVIMAVKRRPRLQSYTNILLACLAATDVLTGLTV
ncbi:hypothetical protein ACROYT_G028159 [Oculina patagonica]